MPSYAAITRERHAGKSWSRFASYSFAKKIALAPLAAGEMAKAMLSFPLGFIRDGEAIVPAAMLSFEPHSNLFVAPDGQWVGRYVPALFRHYPFRLIPTKDGRLALCIDEDSGLFHDGPGGERFFDESGELAEPLKQVLNSLTQIERHRGLTVQACEALARSHVIKPWEIKIKSNTGERSVEGLLQIDEAALNALPLDAFDHLRKKGALPVAYCQLLSMQNLQMLGKLAKAHAEYTQAQGTQVASMFKAPNEGEIDIDWSQFNAEEK
jgi:hypothetical protein